MATDIIEVESELSIAQQSEETRELSISQNQALARYEMEGAIFMAKKYPRSEDKAYTSIIKSCQRPGFADDCTYSFPRGAGRVEGPSVYLAREMARVWGNVRHGVDIISDDEDMRTIRAWSWDVETNTKITADDTFAKLIYRKGKDGAPGKWIKPDERDLRELTNKRGALAVRNCILSLMPSDFINDALREAKKTLKDGFSKNTDDKRKEIILGFSKIGVPVDQIAIYLNHPIESSSPDELAELRTIWKSISDGQSKWSEYIESNSDKKEPPKKTTATVSGSALSKGKATKTQNPHKESQGPHIEDENQESDFPSEAEVALNECTDNEQVAEWLNHYEARSVSEQEREGYRSMAVEARLKLKKQQ